MLLFLKSQLSSLISTVFDFLVTIACVELLRFGYVQATMLGATAGAVCNFILGRVWVFHARSSSKKSQAAWYFVVWLGSLGLNSLGMYLLADLAKVEYIFSKILTSLAVGFFYNYQLHKRLVFRTA